MGYIKNARITRVFGGLLDVALELDIGAGIRCTTPYIRNTPEDNHIVFDFLGVSNWSQLKNKYIRVWIPGFGDTYFLEDVHMIGRERDNKWLDLKRREVVCCRVHWGVLYPVDEKIEREETKMKPNYNAEYIKGLVGGYWDVHRPWGYDREGFISDVDQTMHLIGRESDIECMKYICRKFSYELTEFFFLIMNNDKYIDQLDEYSESPVEELREFATTLMCNIVIAGATDDYSSIAKYIPKF